jgi:hypothetical protein
MRGVPKRYSGKGPVRTNRIAASHVASPVQTVEDCAECGGVKCVEWSYLVSSVATELLFASWRCLACGSGAVLPGSVVGPEYVSKRAAALDVPGE